MLTSYCTIARHAFLFVSVLVGSVSPLLAATAPKVVVVGDKLTVDFENSPAAVAILALEERTGIAIEVPPAVRTRTISISFDEVPIERAMRMVLRTLGVANVAVFHGSDGRPIAFEALGKTSWTRPSQERRERTAAGSLIARTSRR